MLKFCCKVLFLVLTLVSCNNSENSKKEPKKIKQEIIIDCNYTFREAIYGSKAPKSFIKELVLIKVQYYSTDGKIHEGQVLTNKRIAKDIQHMFHFMLNMKFAIAKVIPVVKYKWSDEFSMLDNNSYSFCYRNSSYSKHASGMAIDINPFFNPLRWKKGYEYRKDVPKGAIYNKKVNGTFYPNHPVVKEFRKLGFRWGRTFTRNSDDHHFEKIK